MRRPPVLERQLCKRCVQNMTELQTRRILGSAKRNLGSVEVAEGVVVDYDDAAEIAGVKMLGLACEWCVVQGVRTGSTHRELVGRLTSPSPPLESWNRTACGRGVAPRRPSQSWPPVIVSG